MTHHVVLSQVAEPQAIFAIETAADGMVRGNLIGVTTDVEGETMPSGTLAYRGIVLWRAGHMICIPVGKLVYKKFLQEVERRQITLTEKPSSR